MSDKERIENIEKDDDIYPRKDIEHSTVKSYVEALKAGAEFPPVEVQKVRVDTDEGSTVKTIAIDGWHRILAYRKYNELDGVEPIREIEVTHWKDKIIDKDEWLVDLMSVSAERNSKHGDRLSKEDQKYQARKIAREDPDLSRDEIAEKIGGVVTGRTVGNWIEDIAENEKASRTSFILRQKLLGYSFREIAEQLTRTDLKNVSYESVREKYVSTFGKISKSCQEDYGAGKKIHEIAEYKNIRWFDPYEEIYDLALTWALLLHDKDDRERFEKFGKSKYGDDSPKVYNYWYFPQRDTRIGREQYTEYAGNLAVQVILNLLYYFSNQGDLVVDPMAGGGLVIDSCLLMGRECRAYDKDPVRPDIERNDILSGIPVQDADLIIIDPPYYNMNKEDYEESAFTSSLGSFYEASRKAFTHCYETLAQGGYLTLVMMPQQPMGDKVESFHDHTHKLTSTMEDLGFTEVYRITSPLVGSSQYTGSQIEAAKKRKEMLNVVRDIVVFRK